MQRTTIMLPTGLSVRASRRVKADSVSLGNLIRTSLEKGPTRERKSAPTTNF